MQNKKKLPDMHGFRQRLKRDLKSNWILWAMFLPVVIYYAVFNYAPMYGILLAFKKYEIKKGILGSPWVGLKYFERFFSGYNSWNLIRNTLGLSLYSFLAGFPLAIIFALLLHYLTLGKLKKVVQMVSYAPYFISNVVICNMLVLFMTPDTGIFNILLAKLGLESVSFLSMPEYFKSIYVWSGVWQSMGWSAIIYLSALAGVDPGLHESAIIDGASKLKRILYIDLPSIRSTIVMLMIMTLGGIMNVGFEKVYLLQNDLNFSVSDVISTYTYRVGLQQADFGYSTAIGLFNTLINLVFLIGSNALSRKATGESLW